MVWLLYDTAHISTSHYEPGSTVYMPLTCTFANTAGYHKAIYTNYDMPTILSVITSLLSIFSCATGHANMCQYANPEHTYTGVCVHHDDSGLNSRELAVTISD
jgi:hypothetical protein